MTTMPSNGVFARLTTPGVIGTPWPPRTIRIAMLAGTLVLMSLLDLHITLLYLGSVGLAEENPFARIVMSHGSPALLAGWKVMTVLPTILVVTLYRRRLAAELLAWIACAVLIGVMFRWVQYADQTDLLLISLPALEEGADNRWIRPSR
jgi:hypothetical protein